MLKREFLTKNLGLVIIPPSAFLVMGVLTDRWLPALLLTAFATGAGLLYRCCFHEEAPRTNQSDQEKSQ